MTKCLDSYNHQFRVLVSELIMDDLSLAQIDKYIFVYKLPERLKDHGRDGLRSQLLTYINEQLLNEWMKMPRVLQDVLEMLGRTDLSTKVQELVERYPAMTVCQETQEESAAQGGGKQPPVQETQQFTQIPLQLRDFAPDEVHCDCADKDRSSTEGEGQREAHPQAVSPVSRNTLQSSRYGNMSRKSLSKSRERPLENILEETSLSQDDIRHEFRSENNLKRTDSTASHDSLRSSGYFSNPRTSVLRLSTAESFAENDDEEDSASIGPMRQTHTDSLEDEGVVMNFHQMSDFRADSPESSGTDSSSPPSSPSKSDQTAATVLLAAEEEQVDDLHPIPRRRCNQMTPTHKRRQLPKHDDVLFGDLSPEHGEMRRRSSSLPTTTRTSYVQAQKAGVLMPDITGPQSHSSSTSLDSETTYGSPSEQSSINGSQLSLASAASGHDSKSNSLSRHMSPPTQKPLPVDSEMTVMGSMKVKVKEILKLIDRNSQNPVLSGEFPSFKSHRGPRYEMRFFPSTFSKECSALYIDVARSYLNKKSKRKEQHRMVEIPAMNITVQLSYDGAEGGSIKVEKLETAVRKFNSCGDASERLQPVASFPKLVSHAELGLSKALAEGRSSQLVIQVDMSVRSS